MTELTPGTEEAATGRLRRLALLVEYEGTRYHGFQSQKNATSIQDALERALFRLTGERKRIRGADAPIPESTLRGRWRPSIRALSMPRRCSSRR